MQIRFEVDVSKYPIISRINETLKELEAFKKADAFVQIDCPEELRKAQSLGKAWKNIKKLNMHLP